MKKRIRLPSAVLGLLFVSLASAQTTFVAGALEEISPDSRQITVLGQTYLIDAKTVFSLGSKRISNAAGGRVLSLGNWIAVESGDARRATSVSVFTSPYVSGASPVFVSGKVEQVATDLGTIRIGGLTIDASAALPGSLDELQIGTLVEVSGTQPLSQGVLLADRIVMVGTGADATTHSIGGTGKDALLESIGGTGTGVSAQSIGGTGS